MVAAAHRPNMEQRQLIIDFAAKNRLRTLFGERGFVAAGGLMSYGPLSAAVFRRTAVYVDKILRGVKTRRPREPGFTRIYPRFSFRFSGDFRAAPHASTVR